MTEYLLAFVGGLLGSAHCIGMCGGFVTTLTIRGRPTGSPVARQLTYALGRVFTYAVLGAVAGGIGLQIDRQSGTWTTIRLTLSIAAAFAILIVALHSLGWLPRWRSRHESCVTPKLFAQMYDESLRTHIFLAGMINGLLPCGLVYAYLPLAIAMGRAWAGAAVMASFGLGTIPALALLGLGVGQMSCNSRKYLMHAASGVMIALALLFLHKSIAAWVDPSNNTDDCPLCTPISSSLYDGTEHSTRMRG